MKSDKPSNTNDSGTTSTSGPQHTGKAAKRDYLQEQADDARAAMAQVAMEMKAHLANALDPRALTRRHPWIATGTAAAGGFLIARGLSSSRHRNKREQEGRTKREKGKSRSMFSGIISQLLGMVRPAVVSVIGSAVSSQVNTHHEGNGHAAETSDSSSTI